MAIGSVKTNIGHLEAAAGIAGLIKVVLALQHGELPAHLHLRHAEPAHRLGRAAARGGDRRRPWVDTAAPRIAGVSAFGFSGTNAHVIVGSRASGLAGGRPTTRPAYVLPLSAKSPAALRELAARYARHLAETPGQDLADVCFTAATGRSHFGHRAAVIGGSVGGDAGAARRARRRSGGRRGA